MLFLNYINNDFIEMFEKFDEAVVARVRITDITPKLKLNHSV